MHNPSEATEQIGIQEGRPASSPGADPIPPVGWTLAPELAWLLPPLRAFINKLIVKPTPRNPVQQSALSTAQALNLLCVDPSINNP
jgi:hypothetical protein